VPEELDDSIYISFVLLCCSTISRHCNFWSLLLEEWGK